MRVSYKTLSDSAELSSCSVKHHDLFKTNLFATKIYKKFLLIAVHTSWKFEFNPSRTLWVTDF